MQLFRHSTSSHKLQQLLESTRIGEHYLLAKTASWAQSKRTFGMLSKLTCGAQVYKPKAADVIIMRDYVHGEKVKEATLRYGHVDMHKKELKDKATKAARREDKKEAARVILCLVVGFMVQLNGTDSAVH